MLLMRTATSGLQSSVKKTLKDSMKFFKMTPKMAGQLQRETLTTMLSWCSVMKMMLGAAVGVQLPKGLTLCQCLKVASLWP